MDSNQPAAQPGIAKRAVDGNRLIELCERRIEMTLRGEQKSLHCHGLGVSGRQSKRTIGCFQRARSPAKGEFEFRQACPTKRELGRQLYRGTS